MTAPNPAVLVERHGAVQVITLNRPSQKNALNGEVARGVADAIDELDAARRTSSPDASPAIALEILLTAEPISAARAAEIGLVNRLAPAGTALHEAVSLAGLIAANSPAAAATTKEIVASAEDWTLAEWWAHQPGMMSQVLGSADAREGAAAFAQGRAQSGRTADGMACESISFRTGGGGNADTKGYCPTVLPRYQHENHTRSPA